MKSNNNRALEELNEKLIERKEEQRTKYKNSIVDRDKNYAHGMMLAYGQAAAMVRERMANPTHEDSVLPIQLVVCSNCPRTIGLTVGKQYKQMAKYGDLIALVNDYGDFKIYNVCYFE